MSSGSVAADGMTMIAVTHEIGFAHEVGDSVAFKDDGMGVEREAPEDVLGSPRQARTESVLDKVL